MVVFRVDVTTGISQFLKKSGKAQFIKEVVSVIKIGLWVRLAAKLGQEALVVAFL